MQKTLNFCDQITDVNPSAKLIEQRLRELDTSKNDGFLIYKDAARCFVQTQGDEEIGFLVEYHNADNSIALQTNVRLDIQATLSIFLDFTESDITWITKHEMYDL